MGPAPNLTIAPFRGIITLPPGQEPIVTNRDLPKFNQVIARGFAETSGYVVPWMWLPFNHGAR
jgi:hypothetical protein